MFYRNSLLISHSTLYVLLMFFHSVVSTLSVSVCCVPYCMFYFNIEFLFCSTGMECQIQQCGVQDRVRVWRPGRPHLRLSTRVMSSPLLHHHLIHHQTCHLNKKKTCCFFQTPNLGVFNHTLLCVGEINREMYRQYIKAFYAEMSI